VVTTVSTKPSITQRTRTLLRERPEISVDDAVKILRREYKGKKEDTFRNALYNARSFTKKEQQEAGSKNGHVARKKSPEEPKTYACKYCGQEFTARQIPVHTRYCPKAPGKKAEAEVPPQPPPANPEELDPLQLAVEVRRQATDLGGLEQLTAFLDRCEKYEPSYLLSVVNFVCEIGPDAFEELLEHRTTLKTIQAVGTKAYRTVCTALQNIEAASSSELAPVSPPE